MVAIQTKYHGPTDTRGSRISARFMVGSGKVFIPFLYELDSESRHKTAAEELIGIFNPTLQIVESADVSGGFVFIARPKPPVTRPQNI